VDDEQVLPFNEEQSMVSLPNENEVTVASTDETGDDTTETAEHTLYLLALGRRVLSAGRKLFCCGGCGHNKKVNEKSTKWKYFRGPPQATTDLPSTLRGE